MIIAKFHKSGSEMILAACDSEMIGRTLEEGDICITLEEGFFGKEEVTEDEFRGMLAGATSANMVGERVVAIAMDMDCILPEAVKRISGVPYAMFFCTG